MYNKWLQAVGHALTFDRIDDTALDIGDEPYCSHLIMLFTQLSTLAMLKLHSGHATDDDWLALGSDQGPLGARARHGSKKSKPLKKQATATNLAHLFTGEGGANESGVAFQALHAARPTNKAHRPSYDEAAASHQSAPRRASLIMNEYAAKLAARGRNGDDEGPFAGSPAAKQKKVAFRRRSVIHADEDAMLFTQQELNSLRMSACPVHMTEHRIHRALTTRCRARGWKAPAPVFNRVYTELAEAMAEYDAALKLKMVPVPFGFVQFNAMLLVCFIVLLPISIACFSSTISMSVITSVVTVGGFVSMWLVANEMESPFGTEANSLDLRTYHNDFVMRLGDLFRFEASDTWTVGSGAWRPPACDAGHGCGSSFHSRESSFKAAGQGASDLHQAIATALQEWHRAAAVEHEHGYPAEQEYGRLATPRPLSEGPMSAPISAESERIKLDHQNHHQQHRHHSKEGDLAANHPRRHEDRDPHRTPSSSAYPSSIEAVSSTVEASLSGAKNGDSGGTTKSGTTASSGGRGRNDEHFDYAQEEEARADGSVGHIGSRDRPPRVPRTASRREPVVPDETVGPPPDVAHGSVDFPTAPLRRRGHKTRSGSPEHACHTRSTRKRHAKPAQMDDAEAKAAHPVAEVPTNTSALDA